MTAMILSIRVDGVRGSSGSVGEYPRLKPWKP
jgi:hypothetical protein